MEISTPMRRNLSRHFRRRATLDRRKEREIHKTCEQYHNWCALQKRSKIKPVTIIAEGDSWFKYVVGKSVIYQLERLMDIEIQNLASPSDEVSEMLAPKQLERLAKLLKRGPTRGWKYDFFLFSGGGNDLVGKDRFHKWLHPYKPGMTPAQIINKTTLGAELRVIEAAYQELIEVRNANSPNTQLLFHGYDFAIPNGKGVCWLGPWMEPGLKFRKVPVSKRRETVKLFLIEFDKLLDKLARNHSKVTIVPTHGTLSDAQWANELHPTNGGFKQIAKIFKTTIDGLVT